MTNKESERRERMFTVLSGLGISRADAEILRRASMTLQRWSEGECGDSNRWASWAIERDPVTEIPYRVTHPFSGAPSTIRERIPDREAGALRRVAAVIARAKRGVKYYHQTDPRGCALYVGRGLTGSNYNSVGVAVW